MPRRRKPFAKVNEKTIGSQLRAARKRRGLTQVEVAKELGITQALVSAYELGEVRVHGALLASLAQLLKVSADEILGLKEAPENGLFKDRRFIRRLHQIQELPKRKKQALLMTLDDYLKGTRASIR